MTDTTEALRPRIDLSSCIDGDLCAIVGMRDSGCGEIVYKSRQPVVYAVLAALSQPEARQPESATPQAAQAEPMIAGALFDFLGFLTSSDECWTFSSRHEAGPAVRALEQWAAKRGLRLGEADVAGWRKDLPAAPAQGGQPGDAA
jgi:hypothetical protein